MVHFFNMLVAEALRRSMVMISAHFLACTVQQNPVFSYPCIADEESLVPDGFCGR